MSKLTTESWIIRAILIMIALSFMLALVALPLAAVFAEAFAKGWEAYGDALAHRHAISAIQLTLLVAAIAVPFNVVFGLCASWAIAKYEFVGKRLLIPLSICHFQSRR